MTKTRNELQNGLANGLTFTDLGVDFKGRLQWKNDLA